MKGVYKTLEENREGRREVGEGGKERERYATKFIEWRCPFNWAQIKVSITIQ